MKLRTVLLSLVSLLLVFGMAACTSAPATTPATTTAAEDSETTTTAADTTTAAEGGETTAAEGSTRTKLVWGTNAAFIPFEMREGDKVIGVDAEIAQAVADKMGVELVVEDMEFDALPAALESGKIDFIAAGFTKNAEREATMDFSNEYFTAVQGVVVKEGNPVGISSEEDLKGKKIGVQTGTTGDLYFASEVEGADVQRYENIQMACQDLVDGRIDCVIGDNLPVVNLMSSISGLEKVDSIVYEEEKYAMAVKKGENADVLTAINEVLTEMEENGEIEALVEKYSVGE